MSTIHIAIVDVIRIIIIVIITVRTIHDKRLRIRAFLGRVDRLERRIIGTDKLKLWASCRS
jgi:hypothetical protein